MGSYGQVKLKAVWEMMSICAKGFTVKEKPHSFWVYFNDRTYPWMPKYEEIPLGHLKKMIRHLLIDSSCAKKHLP